MVNRGDIEPLLTDADVTSETRFGPRHPPEGHRPHGSPYEARHIPPHGDVSPDGKHIWPQPSQSSRILVWGGMALATAAVTAASVLAARRVIEMVQNDDHPPAPHPAPQPPKRRKPSHQAAPHLAPRFAEMDGQERQELRNRTRERELEDALAAAHQRAEAAEEAVKRARRRARPARKNFISEVESNTRRLSGSADSAIGSLSAAFSGFRAVAAQAAGIVGEFETAAKVVRGLMAKGSEQAKEAVKDEADEIRQDFKDRRDHRL
ncbi:hypothetical protein [Paracoccus sp. (in: a-proteobacteria)]|uniref:hypothetical protein n=1 Tax=Paracoccus sp. TaxID=267 RepID=UPI0028A01892|nr:hypothetical protein [Paracoccus sp. (in: a-proteobacteria)]